MLHLIIGALEMITSIAALAAAATTINNDKKTDTLRPAVKKSSGFPSLSNKFSGYRPYSGYSMNCVRQQPQIIYVIQPVVIQQPAQTPYSQPYTAIQANETLNYGIQPIPQNCYPQVVPQNTYPQLF